MNDKEFRDAVYQKYERYQSGERVIEKGFQKSVRPTLTVALLIAMFTIFVLGTTAATYYFSGIWKEPEPYDYEEELEITDEMKEEAISEETVIKKAEEYLEQIGSAGETVVAYQLINDPSKDKTSWEVETKGGCFLRLDGKTGRLEHFSIANIQKEYADSNDAEPIGKLLMQNLGFDIKNYGSVKFESDGSGRWWMECYQTYDGVLNPYQAVRLLFAPAAKEVILVVVFDEPFENNPYVISHSEALFIADGHWGEDAQEITAEKTIEKMNAHLYQKEHEGSYRTEQIVRNVWKVTATRKETGFKEQIFIDGTTGELIGGDQMK